MDFDYNYGYSYGYDPLGSNFENAVVTMLFSIYLIVLTAVLIFALVSYIFRAVGLYTIGKRMGRKYPWLVFIPFARSYFQGELAGEIVLKNKTIKNPGIWNLVIPIIGGVSSGIFLIVFMLVGGFGVMAGGRRSADFILIWMLLMYVIYILLLIAVNVVRTILLVLINKQILEQFTSENMALVHSVVSQFVPLYEAFCFFAMRNKNFREGKEPVLTPPPAPIPPVPPVHPAGEPDRPVPPVPPVHPDRPVPPVSLVHSAEEQDSEGDPGKTE